MSIDSRPITGVRITRQTSRSVFAQVNRRYQVWIHDLGNDSFRYSCSCHQWSTDVENGRLSYCPHYLAVIAKLKLDRKIQDNTKINLVDEEGISKINKYMTALLETRKVISKNNQFLLNQGKIFLCEYCKKLPRDEINVSLDLPNPLYIKEIRQTTGGFIVKGIGRCIRCGKVLNIVNKIPFELSGLKCPNCGKNDFTVTINETKRCPEGYEFSVSLQCNTRSCSWKKALKTSIQSVNSIFNKVKRIKITPESFEFEAKDGANMK